MRVASSAIWTIAGQGYAILARLIVGALLWRWLDADDFGVVALVFVLLQAVQMFTDVGIGPAIVQSSRGGDRRFLNTLWTLQLLRGGTVWLVYLALAWPMAYFYEDGRLVSLLPVAGLTALIGGFTSTAVFTLNRELRFGSVVVNEGMSQTSGAVVGIAWAYVSPSPWALVASAVAAAVVTTLLSYRLPDSRQQFMLDRACLREQWRFGRWMTVSSVCTFLATGSDRLILGALVPSAVLGVYANAVNVSQMPAQLLQTLGSRVMFPLMAMKHREGDFRETFARFKSVLVAATGLAVIGLVVLGPTVVPLVFGVKAAESGWMVQILAAGLWFASLEAINSKVVLTRGNTKWIAAATVSRFVVIAAALPAAFFLDGVRGALICVALSDLPRYAVSALGAKRAGVHVLVNDLASSVVLAIATAVGLLALRMPELTSDLRAVVAFAAASGVWFVARVPKAISDIRFLSDRWQPRSIPT